MANYKDEESSEKRYKPETSNSSINRFIHEINDLAPDVFRPLVQVVQTIQFAVPHIAGVVVVGDRARTMEIVPTVWYRVVTALVRVRSGTTGAQCVRVVRAHVVHHSVDVNSDTSSVTSSNHVFELFLITRSCDPQIGDRLVAFPPWSLNDHYVLLNR